MTLCGPQGLGTIRRPGPHNVKPGTPAQRAHLSPGGQATHVSGGLEVLRSSIDYMADPLALS